MTAYRPVYDSRQLQADCQGPGSARGSYRLGSRVWASCCVVVVGQAMSWQQVSAVARCVAVTSLKASDRITGAPVSPPPATTSYSSSS